MQFKADIFVSAVLNLELGSKALVSSLRYYFSCCFSGSARISEEEQLKRKSLLERLTNLCRRVFPGSLLLCSLCQKKKRKEKNKANKKVALLTCTMETSRMFGDTQFQAYWMKRTISNAVSAV